MNADETGILNLSPLILKIVVPRDEQHGGSWLLQLATPVQVSCQENPVKNPFLPLPAGSHNNP